MGEMIAQWWLQWLLGVLATGLAAGLRLLWKRQRATERGIQALLRDRLIQAYYHYEERGSISLHGLEAVESMYAEYHDLGGNGSVTKLVNAMRQMRVDDN